MSRHKTRNVRERQARRYMRRLKPASDVWCCNLAFPLWGTRTLDKAMARKERADGGRIVVVAR